mmetsp:Transcript_29617/g.36742  ORF Transcript_29617/g.36742 Transcript_29617/m.36742 type:complete len:92 (+) Transcript_29617:1882-2157(+)
MGIIPTESTSSKVKPRPVHRNEASATTVIIAKSNPLSKQQSISSNKNTAPGGEGGKSTTQQNSGSKKTKTASANFHTVAGNSREPSLLRDT